MTKNCLYLLYLVHLLTSCSNSKQFHVPDSIANKKTEKHVNLPGTKVFIVPPEGFNITESSPGLSKSETSGLQIMDMVGGHYFEDSKIVRENIVKTNQLKLVNEKEILFNGFNGIFSIYKPLAQSEEGSTFFTLAFGNSEFFLVALGKAKNTDTLDLRLIKKSMLSIYYDENKTISPFETANFALDDSETELKFAGYTGGVFAYNIGGLDKAYYYPLLTVVQHPSITEKDLEVAAFNTVNNLTNIGVTHIKLKQHRKIHLNGFPAFEAEYSGSWNGKGILVYINIILLRESCIVMQGIMDNNFEDSLIQFKKLSKTIKEK